MINIHRQKQLQAALTAGKTALAKTRQHKKIDRAPGFFQGQIHHRLTKFVFGIRVFDQVSLINDVDQVIRLSNTPEYPAHAHPQFPAAPRVHISQLADISVGASCIVLIQSRKRHKQNTIGTVVPGPIEFRVECQRDIRICLFG